MAVSTSILETGWGERAFMTSVRKAVSKITVKAREKSKFLDIIK